MKGLVLKDFYLLTRYCRNFLLVAFVFLVMYISNPGNTAAITMLCAVTGILPITLLSYDEREGWITYCQTLPYTKAQYVSAKYVMGLFVCLGSMVLLGLLVIFLPGGDEVARGRHDGQQQRQNGDGIQSLVQASSPLEKCGCRGPRQGREAKSALASA